MPVQQVETPEYDDEYENNFIPIQETPILKDIQLDNKIISSHAKNKFIFLKPLVKEEIVAIPLIDEKRRIVYKEVLLRGQNKKIPVIKKFIRTRYLDGFDKEEMDFPIADWFNDSVPSSILEKKEARYLRSIDDLGVSLMMKVVREPDKYQVIGFLERLYSQKMSIADTGKGIGGGAIEKAKTSITKSEQTAYMMRNDKDELDSFRQKKTQANKGLFGFGVDVPLLGRV